MSEAFFVGSNAVQVPHVEPGCEFIGRCQSCLQRCFTELRTKTIGEKRLLAADKVPRTVPPICSSWARMTSKKVGPSFWLGGSRLWQYPLRRFSAGLFAAASLRHLCRTKVVSLGVVGVTKPHTVQIDASEMSTSRNGSGGVMTLVTVSIPYSDATRGSDRLSKEASQPCSGILEASSALIVAVKLSLPALVCLLPWR